MMMLSGDDDMPVTLTLAGCIWWNIWQGVGPGPQAIQARTQQALCLHWHHLQTQSPRPHLPFLNKEIVIKYFVIILIVIF